jgi:hypothetical protein
MTADLRELLQALSDGQPAPVDWAEGVRRRVRTRRRHRSALIAAVAVSALAVGLALPGHARNRDYRLVPAGPRPESLTLTPGAAEAKVGEVVTFTAVATSPGGPPVIQDPYVDASGTGFGDCASAAPGSAASDGTARRTFEESFDVAGVHTLEVSALPPTCQDGSWKATSMVQVSDPKIDLTNEITITAKVISQPRAGQSDLVLDVTASGSREKPSISGFYVNHDVFFVGDRCEPLGILPAHGPGVFHQVYRYRYEHPGTDTITLFASSLCSPAPGQARLDVKIDVLP